MLSYRRLSLSSINLIEHRTS